MTWISQNLKDKLKAAFRRPSRLDRDLFLVETVTALPPAGDEEEQREPAFVLRGWLAASWRDPEYLDIYVFPAALPDIDPQTVETLPAGQWLEVEAAPSPAPLPKASRLARSFRIRDDLSAAIGREVLANHVAESAPKP